MLVEKKFFINSKIFLNNLKSRRFIIIFFDLSVCLFSLWIAFFLRLDKFYSLQEMPPLPILISLSLLIFLIFFFQIHKSINRYSGLDSFIQLSKALIIYSIIFCCCFTLYTFDKVPRTIGIIQPILLSLLILSSRAMILYFFTKFHHYTNKKMNSVNCLIYGAGDAGRQLARIIKNDHNFNFIGFLDDKKTLEKTKINNNYVYNPIQLELLKKKYKIELVLLAIPSLSIKEKTKILSKIQHLKINVRTLPDLNELTSGKIDISNVRDLNINELLGRQQISLRSLLSNTNIKDTNVLITGGGGSIGSEICRQISLLNPKKIIIVELNEYSLYSIQQEIEEKIQHKKIKVVPKLASILNEDIMDNIFNEHRPDVIFHTAAYKHVKLVENNPITSLENNVFGTLKVAKFSSKYSVRNFILISSDKAVRPTNIMGASKRLSELIIQAFQAENTGTIFSIVRFGNVLGSSGSVVPKFLEQIKLGGPLTLTDEKVTRFFMTINEAVSLVIKASLIAKGGEVFVLNMGDPIKIIDLAKRMIELSGKTIKSKQNLNGDIEIKIIGLSKGEKLYEELLIGNNPIKTNEDKIMIAQENFLEWKYLEKHLNNLNEYLKKSDLKNIKRLLVNIGTDYNN